MGKQHGPYMEYVSGDRVTMQLGLAPKLDNLPPKHHLLYFSIREIIPFFLTR